MFINMINIKWLLLHTNFLHFCYILVHTAQFYGLHFEFVEKETRKHELCLHGNMFAAPGCQLSQLSSLLQDNITKDNKLPAADGAVVDGG